MGTGPGNVVVPGRRFEGRKEDWLVPVAVAVAVRKAGLLPNDKPNDKAAASEWCRGRGSWLVTKQVDELGDKSHKAHQTGKDSPLADWLSRIGQGATSFLWEGAGQCG